MDTSGEGALLGDSLMAQVARALPGFGRSSELDARFLEAVRTVLLAGGLSHEESTLVSSSRGGCGVGRALLDRLIESRLNRALQKAVKTVAAAAGRTVPGLLPRIVVVRAEEGGRRSPDPTATATTLAQRLDLDPESLRIGDSPDAQANALVMTDHPSYLDLKTTLGASATTSFHGALGSGPGVPVETATAPVMVVRVPETLAMLGTRIAKALPVAEVPAPGEAAGEEDLIGRVLGGKYRIERVQGEGGFGTVYEATDLMLEARVAVKILHPRVARSQAALNDFLQEAKRLTSLDHENVVRWITFDKTEDGLHYFVMEYLQGQELSKLLKREGGRLPARRVLNILHQVLAALEAAHHLPGGRALLHLDLKPQNIFIQPGKPERVKVIDFGISQHIGAEARVAQGYDVAQGFEPSNENLEHSVGSTFSTRSSASAADAAETPVRRARGGTPKYASPEQCAHLAGHAVIRPLDGRSDLYSLGVMAFLMLTGKHPFVRCHTLEQAFQNHLEVPPRRLRSMGVRVPRALAAFVDRCLVKNRDERWADTHEAFESLDRILHPPLWQQMARVALPVLAIALPLLWWLWPDAGPLQPFEAFASAGGREASIASDLLYAGPDRRRIQLRVDGVEPHLARAGCRLTTRQGPDAPALKGWIAEHNGDQLALLAPADGTSALSTVYLELAGEDGPPQYSHPFTIAYVGRGAWDIGSVRVPGREDRAVDPAGQQLEIALSGSVRDLAAVEVLHDGQAYAARRSATQATAEQVTYTLALERLKLPDGEVPLTVRVTDRADGRRELRYALVVKSSGLEIRSAGLSGTRLGEHFVLMPGSDAILSVTLNHPSTLSWTIEDEEGRPLASGGPLPEALVVSQPLGLTDLKGGASYAGVLRLTAEDAGHVARAAGSGRGRVERSLRFKYRTELPEFTAGLRAAAGRSLVAMEEGQTVYLGQLSTTINVRRVHQDVPMRVELVCRAEQEGLVVPSPEPVLLDSRDQPAGEFALEFPREGPYAVELLSRRHDTSAGAAAAEAEVRRSFRVLVDTTAPRVRLEGPPGGLVVRSRQEQHSIDVRIEDEAHPPSGERTPVTLRWSLFRGASQTPIVEPRMFAEQPGALPSVRLDLPRPWELAVAQPPGGHDGDHRLVVTGWDEAGHAVAATGFGWVVATEPPQARLVRPNNPKAWTRNPGTGRWDLEIEATDPNGVAEVSCTLFDEGVAGDRPGGNQPIVLGLEKAEDIQAGLSSRWRGAADFGSAWSGATVRLRLHAVDSQGVSAARDYPTRFLLEEIAPARPERIAVRLAGRDLPLGSMRIVPGNAGLDYVFGGRGDDTENRDFRSRFGLAQFDTSRVERSWAIRYAAGEIGDFYLDEQEVSAGQYHAFLQAADGYRDGRHWPAGSGPVPARQQLLAKRLGAPPARDLPVTGVDWAEALAYARWLGKRLPSYVEWEYAVRGGGGAYRPFSSAAEGEGPPSERELNHDRRVPYQGSAWPVGRGGDLTPGTRIRNLCSNVAEWTSTPVSFAGGGRKPAERLSDHARQNAAFVLDPTRWPGWEQAPEHWVVGGSFGRPRFDFSAAEATRRGRRGLKLGFRCALSLQEVRRMLEGQGAREGTCSIEVIE